jgi:hypothetical protein
MDSIIKNMLKNLSHDELTEIKNLINSILQRRNPANKLAPKLPDKLAPKLPDKLAPKLPDKLAPKLPDKLAPKLPDKLAPKLPDKLAPKLPDKLAPKLPDKILPSKIVVKSDLKYPAKRKTKQTTIKTKKRKS